MKKVLIANRGEIAVRIVRACRDYGVQSVAVYANADIDALHTRMADEAYGLDGDRPAETYLHTEKLLAIAQKSGADAVHPGYGFLSESAAFAQAVIDAGLAWIGPSPQAIARLGDKIEARKIALKVGAPLVVGTSEPVKDAGEVLQFAEQHGLPIIIEAAFGGGGRGMKIAWRMDEVAELHASAVREATAAFGRGECFVEQFLDKPRHIEAQVMGDRHGKVVVLGTRDCSLQRRNQKLVEEAPAPFLSDAQRQRIHQAAHDICAEVGYESAGTVEFLLSASGAISFLEVNTRLQVEHPVTEQTTGLDLVVEQLRVADGLPLSVDATPVPLGHAMEFRINAEDVGRGFLPSSGPVTRFDMPSGPGVRVDTGVLAGSGVPGSFDSLMAKLIVTGATREQTLARARRALAEFEIEGVASVLPFHRAVVQAPAFTAPEGALGVHTRWIETEMPAGFAPAPRPDALQATPLWHTFVEVDGKRLRLGLPVGLALHGLLGGAVQPPAATLPRATPEPAPGDVPTPLAGSLVAWHRRSGDAVQAGETLAVMEAMKMETPITAPQAGTLECLADVGEMLPAGQLLARVR